MLTIVYIGKQLIAGRKDITNYSKMMSRVKQKNEKGMP